MALRDQSFDPVQIAQVGEVAAGLEGAVATSAGTVLLWGWLFSPPGRGIELECELGGTTAPVELLDRTPRPDVIESFAASVQGRSPEVGFLALTQVDPESLRAAGGRVRLVLRSDDGASTTANRLLFEPGSTFQQTVGRRLPVRVMRPEALGRAAEALWPPEGARILAAALASIRSHRIGPALSPELSIIIPLAGNVSALRHTLSYLDMDPDMSRVELVLPLTRDELWGVVERAVEDAATSLSVKLVPAGEALSVGGAARLGLEVAAGEQVMFMSDAVAPPRAGWMSSLVEDLSEADFAAPEAMPRFDGSIHRFEPRSPPRDASIWSHEAMRTHLSAGLLGLGLDRRSPGILAGRRAALLAAEVAWTDAMEAPAFWMDLLNEAVRHGAHALRCGDQFTYAPVERDREGDTQLLDMYGLERRLRRSLESAGASRLDVDPS